MIRRQRPFQLSLVAMRNESATARRFKLNVERLESRFMLSGSPWYESHSALSYEADWFSNGSTNFVTEPHRIDVQYVASSIGPAFGNRADSEFEVFGQQRNFQSSNYESEFWRDSIRGESTVNLPSNFDSQSPMVRNNEWIAISKVGNVSHDFNHRPQLNHEFAGLNLRGQVVPTFENQSNASDSPVFRNEISATRDVLEVLLATNNSPGRTSVIVFVPQVSQESINQLAGRLPTTQISNNRTPTNSSQSAVSTTSSSDSIIEAWHANGDPAVAKTPFQQNVAWSAGAKYSSIEMQAVSTVSTRQASATTVVASAANSFTELFDQLKKSSDNTKSVADLESVLDLLASEAEQRFANAAEVHSRSTNAVKHRQFDATPTKLAGDILFGDANDFDGLIAANLSGELLTEKASWSLEPSDAWTIQVGFCLNEPLNFDSQSSVAASMQPSSESALSLSTADKVTTSGNFSYRGVQVIGSLLSTVVGASLFKSRRKMKNERQDDPNIDVSQ